VPRQVEQLYSRDAAGRCSPIFVEYTRTKDRVIRLVRVYVDGERVRDLDEKSRAVILRKLTNLPVNGGLA